jgi:putative DNA primase/helicase
LVVLPPTKHESGDLYPWYNLAAPIIVPDSLLALWRLRKTNKQTGFSLYQLPDEIPYGERNNVLWSFGRSLRAAGADKEHIARRVREANYKRCKPPFPAWELERQIKHICEWHDKPEFRSKAAAA